MRYNKNELVALASQTSTNFDREGVLLLKEKQDGFFRRSEGCSVRWFRLRGNLLFYLKGPEHWHEPSGVIVLGHHQIKVQPQDENGHWPFHIVWNNGVCFKMATFHESERTLWLKSIQFAPYDSIHAQMLVLKERLNKIRPVVDISTYRIQNGIITDMNEVPMYELALSCDNLLCDNYGRPPSPMAVVYIRYPKGQCVRYSCTEVVERSSNPSFSKTILFRTSDGLTGNVVVKIVVYDVKEVVSETNVPMGFTALQLSTIQEAQRLRIALQTRDCRTVGFVTINGWSLEASYSGASPCHNNNEKNTIDISQKLLCHRRSQSLPPKLGLKLKFPAYGNLFKQNFVNSHQVTYRFHSGLGGDITVHEVMAEPKICYQIPIQLLDIYIKREKELLEGLLSIGEMCRPWQNRQHELVSIHVSLLKHYCHAKRSLQKIQNVYFKASADKDNPSLEFAPINLHLQRMWVYNDTLNKTGFHDVITVGAFATHAHNSENTGGLIQLVQQMKDMSNMKVAINTAAANRIQAVYDKVSAVKQLTVELTEVSEKIVELLRVDRRKDVIGSVEEVKSKFRSILSYWEPDAIEESLSYVGWSNSTGNIENGVQSSSTIRHLTEHLNESEATSPDCGIDRNFAQSSSSSSKETSPTGEHPLLSSSVPNICPKEEISGQDNCDSGLEFDNDYFNIERRESRSNHSFRSVRLSKRSKVNDAQSTPFDSNKRHRSLRYNNTEFLSLEQVSYKNLMDNLSGDDKKKDFDLLKDSLILSSSNTIDPKLRESNQIYLNSIASNIETALDCFVSAVNNVPENDDSELLSSLQGALKCNTEEVCRWLRLSHAALRLRCEATAWAREQANLQTRRDTCFSQALTAVTAGLLCWFNSAPHDIIVKLLSSGIGPLCGFSGLLSLYEAEKAMWGDMVVAVEDLHTIVFVLSKVGHSNTSIPQVNGVRGCLTVSIPISDTLYAKFTSKEHLTFTVTAVFFNIGINHKATLAEALGETTPQHQSNCDNLDRLNKYYAKYCKVFPNDPGSAGRTSSRTKPLEEVMENIRIAVHKRLPKNVEVLHLAALATALMNGIRFTSCKSAKDRTGMSVTLEQCTILSSEYHLAEHEFKKAINVMRSEGCRRENTLKNIGVKKYAFTKKQVMSLPEDYRPTPGTYGSQKT